MNTVDTSTTVKLPKVGSLIKYKSKYSRNNVWYVEITGFYNIDAKFGGGRGFDERRLNGTGTGHVPEAHVEKFKKFDTVAEMQKDIDAGKQLIF